MGSYLGSRRWLNPPHHEGGARPHSCWGGRRGPRFGDLRLDSAWWGAPPGAAGWKRGGCGSSGGARFPSRSEHPEGARGAPRSSWTTSTPATTWPSRSSLRRGNWDAPEFPRDGAESPPSPPPWTPPTRRPLPCSTTGSSRGRPGDSPGCSRDSSRSRFDRDGSICGGEPHPGAEPPPLLRGAAGDGRALPAGPGVGGSLTTTLSPRGLDLSRSEYPELLRGRRRLPGPPLRPGAGERGCVLHRPGRADRGGIRPPMGPLGAGDPGPGGGPPAGRDLERCSRIRWVVVGGGMRGATPGALFRNAGTPGPTARGEWAPRHRGPGRGRDPG